METVQRSAFRIGGDH